MLKHFQIFKYFAGVSIIFMFFPLVSAETKGIVSGERYDRLIIRNVLVIDGKGTPVTGPADIWIEGNMIKSVTGARTSEDAYDQAQHVIDGTGLYLMPGIINIHAHIHDNRNGVPIPFDYLYKLWLTCGITTVRDVGSNIKLTLEERRKSSAGEIAAPRIYLYMRAGGRTPEDARRSVQQIKQAGGDGVKIFGMDRDIMEAVMDEAHKQGLRVSHHVGVEETDAWDDAAFGVTSIEHWYGIPDAALHGSQNFPYGYNYSNENDRFRYGCLLWREADPVKLEELLSTLV